MIPRRLIIGCPNSGLQYNVFLLSVSLSVLPFVWVSNKILEASRQVDVIIVGFKGIFVMLLQ